MMPLNPTLRTLTVEQVCYNWQHNSRPPMHAWTEVDIHLNRLPLHALQRVHVRLHESMHGVCSWFECDGCEFPTDHDQWKHQVEDAMPLLKSRGILEVEVVKRQLTKF